MNRFFIMRHSLLLLSTLLLAWPVLAFEGKHREIDWNEALQLSEQQQQQIEAIEQRYREQRRDRSEAGCDAVSRLREQHQRQQQLREDIQQVLTPAQVEVAQRMMREQHRRMQASNARELSHRLEMTAGQKQRFMADVEALQDHYQWPLDIGQLEQARERFEQVLQQHLTAPQRERWQRLQDSGRHKWHRPDEFIPACGDRPSAAGD